MDINKEYQRWLEETKKNQALNTELKNMNPEQIEDAFYRDLAFGTGGLRGVIGAGTNRMNVYTVAKASQGLANYLHKAFPNQDLCIAISRDSRILSDEFAKVSASVFAANQIHVYMYKEIMPTPCLSFAVRELGCQAGIMVTASHNPAIYNGYKVYGKDGCQITTEAADRILHEIETLDIFEDIKQNSFEDEFNQGNIKYIHEDIITSFIQRVKNESVLFGDEINKDVSIVYSPLNGTGLKPILRVLKESGYTQIHTVKKQELPDGSFPTCPFPNPEIKEAMALSIETAKEKNADICLATDPDCDRVGIALHQGDDYVLLSGNEVGVLLLDYILKQRQKHEQLPANPVFIKTIVTTEMAKKIAEDYGVLTIDVLTGFKYIGEQIGYLESLGKENQYILGFEESYGYLTGTYVRDKDGVDGAYIILEMFAYYKTQGMSLFDQLESLYQKYGYYLNTLYSYQFEGSSGFMRMQEILRDLRKSIQENKLTTLGSCSVEEVLDYAQGINDLPKSDVIKFFLQGGHTVVVRPSGTEPKMKVYIETKGQTREESKEVEQRLHQEIEQLFQ